MNAAANLPDDIDALKAIILAQQEQNERLEALVAAFRQAMFGRKSEKADPDQFELALEDIEVAIARVERPQSIPDRRTAAVELRHNRVIGAPLTAIQQKRQRN